MKYHQTKGACLLLDDPWLYLDIRDFSEVPQIKAIIDGTYVCLNNTDPAVKTFLRHLQRPTTFSDKEPHTLMSLVAYREYWKTVKENTSSQGNHTRMYKVAAQKPLLVWIFHQEYEILYLSGYSLRQHCIGTNVMLPKISDSWDVKDLITIVLLDSEANHTYKCIRKEATRAAIEHGKIAPAQ